MDLETLASEMRAGFSQVNKKLDETAQGLNQRIDETNHRLDETNRKIDRFQHEVGGKLDGIQSFLLASERNVGRLEHRIELAEKRLDKLEDQQDKSA